MWLCRFRRFVVVIFHLFVSMCVFMRLACTVMCVCVRARLIVFIFFRLSVSATLRLVCWHFMLYAIHCCLSYRAHWSKISCISKQLEALNIDINKYTKQPKQEIYSQQFIDRTWYTKLPVNLVSRPIRQKTQPSGWNWAKSKHSINPHPQYSSGLCVVCLQVVCVCVYVFFFIHWCSICGSASYSSINIS